MTNVLRIFAAVAALALATPAAAQQIAVDDSFVLNASGWTGGMSGRFIFAWRPAMIGGVPHSCGAYAVTNAQLRPVVRTMLRGGAVTAGGQAVLSDLRHWNRVSRVANEADLIGRAATCAPLPAAVAGREDISLSFGNSSFRN